MRAIPAVLLSALALAGAGCPGPVRGPVVQTDVDGVPCRDDATLGERRVYIDLDYAPATTVPACAVDAGTEITWRGPEGVRRGFAIDFVTASPAGPGAPLHYESDDRDRSRVSLTADNAPGSYEYHYSVGGRVVDPVIIIRR